MREPAQKRHEADQRQHPRRPLERLEDGNRRMLANGIGEDRLGPMRWKVVKGREQRSQAANVFWNIGGIDWFIPAADAATGSRLGLFEGQDVRIEIGQEDVNRQRKLLRQNLGDLVNWPSSAG